PSAGSGSSLLALHGVLAGSGSGPGLGQPVQAGPDPLGERGVDAFDPGDLLRARGLEPAQPAEMPQQVSATTGSDAGDVLQPAGVARLGAAPAVAGDGEAVGLVAYLLHQLQARRFRARADLAAVRQQERLVPGAPLEALGHADQYDALGDAQLGQYAAGLRHLAGAAVDQQRAGRRPALGHRAPEGALARPVHGGVVVARFYDGDVVSPVLAAHRAVLDEHHLRGHRRLAHGVADVE